MRFHNVLRSLTITAAVMLPLATVATPKAHAGIFIQVGFAPPALPVYVQPPIPGEGYIWTPGYWAYGDAGYYWVPGVWVLAPRPGYLWTPAWWGWEGGFYRWHAGYWGPHIGYYGGINYGFGYGGIGFCGGEWRGGHFFYNSAVVNFGGGYHPTNVYVDREVVVHNTIINNNHVAFNGPGGVNRQPSPEEARFSGEAHLQPTGEQMQHESFAAKDRTQYAAFNGGRPGTMAAANVNAYHNQAGRIAQGERAGEMTSGEAARADQRQANIDRQVHNDRVDNGGRLTGQERQQVNHEQNQASRQIYNEKHNDVTAPRAQPRPQPQPRPQAQPRPQPAPHAEAPRGGGEHEKH
jgi:hypothetical protein